MTLLALLSLGFFSVAGEAPPEEEVTDPVIAEFNWPGLSMNRESYRERQRASLQRGIAEAKAAKAKTRKAARKAAKDIIKEAVADGILGAALAKAYERPIISAIQGSVSFAEMMRQIEAMAKQVEERNAAFAERYEDDMIAVLLMAA